MPCRPLLALLLLSAAATAAAQGTSSIFKCRAADGSLTYQDTPCAAAKGAEVVEMRSTGAVKRPRALEGPCLELARELWRLNGSVNLTELGAEGRERQSETRSRLNNQCRVDLDRTELSAQCAQLERRINVESRRDPQALGRLGKEFEAGCSDAVIEEDIRRHVQDIGAGKTWAD